MKLVSKSPTCVVEKEIITEGIFSRLKPTERSVCRIKISDVNYSESSTDDQLFPSEYLKQYSSERTIIIGDASARIDECIERVVGTMFKGERSLTRITESSCENVFADFKIELVDYEARKPIWDWTAKEKYEVALNYKVSGVALYKSVRIVEAFFKFSKACKILITLEPIDDHETEETLRKDIDNLRKVLYNNMAECHLIRGSYERAIKLCDKVLAREENNVKALYRRAVANENLKDYETALADMERVGDLEPRNSAARERLVLYRSKVAEAKKRYDNIVRKMFPSLE